MAYAMLVHRLFLNHKYTFETVISLWDKFIPCPYSHMLFKMLIIHLKLGGSSTLLQTISSLPYKGLILLGKCTSCPVII